MRDWLETFLAHARQTYEAPLPRYVEQELRGYLRCGVFAHGFVRAHCDTCGHDLLVAFSCKARGTVRPLRDEAEFDEGYAAMPEPPRSEGDAVDLDGFNLHASVAIAGDDDLGRERLMRYGARPPFALDRLRRLADGRIAYRIKKLRDGRAKHRVMTPVELGAGLRLSAIIPPP